VIQLLTGLTGLTGAATRPPVASVSPIPATGAGTAIPAGATIPTIAAIATVAAVPAVAAFARTELRFVVGFSGLPAGSLLSGRTQQGLLLWPVRRWGRRVPDR